MAFRTTRQSKSDSLPVRQFVTATVIAGSRAIGGPACGHVIKERSPAISLCHMQLGFC